MQYVSMEHGKQISENDLRWNAHDHHVSRTYAGMWEKRTQFTMTFQLKKANYFSANTYYFSMK